MKNTLDQPDESMHLQKRGFIGCIYLTPDQFLEYIITCNRDAIEVLGVDVAYVSQ